MPLYGSLWARQDFSMTMDKQTNVRGRRRWWRRGSYPWITAGCRHRAGFWWILKLKLSWREVPSLQEHMELLQVGLLLANMFISWIEVRYQRWEMTVNHKHTHSQRGVCGSYHQKLQRALGRLSPETPDNIRGKTFLLQDTAWRLTKSWMKGKS